MWSIVGKLTIGKFRSSGDDAGSFKDHRPTPRGLCICRKESSEFVWIKVRLFSPNAMTSWNYLISAWVSNVCLVRKLKIAVHFFLRFISNDFTFKTRKNHTHKKSVLPLAFNIFHKTALHPPINLNKTSEPQSICARTGSDFFFVMLSVRSCIFDGFPFYGGYI